jgi:hypothetical protein
MAFSVNEMMATINSRGGLSKSSKFMVYFRKLPSNITSGSGGQLGGQERELSFMCESASIPGIAYQTDDIRSSGYGNIEKRPYATIYQDVTLNFFCDNSGTVVAFMHKWLQSVFNFNDSAAPDSSTNGGLVKNSFGYPKDYFGTIEIVHYTDEDSAEKQIFSVSLEEAYPINIGEIQVDWNNQDTLTKIPVTFAYTYWSSETLDQGTIDSNSETRAASLASIQTRIDSNLSSIREAIGITNPTQRGQ